MFVRGRIDQLHVNANTIPGTAHAAFQNVGNTERLPDLAQILRLAAERHDRCARNYFQVADLRQVRQNIVLNSVGEVSVLLIVAQIFKRKHRDRFVDLAGGRARKEKETGGGGNNDAGGNKHDDVAAEMRPRRRSCRRRFYTLRSNVERPRQNQGNRKTDQ